MTRPKILFFDVNETLLDLAPLRESVGLALGGRPEQATLWFRILLQHAQSMILASRYENFDAIGVACLQMLGQVHGMKLSSGEAARELSPMRSLPPHGDVVKGLEGLRDSGFRLAMLTNSATNALADQLKNSGLAPFFDGTFSVEEVGQFKPHAHVYR